MKYEASTRPSKYREKLKRAEQEPQDDSACPAHDSGRGRSAYRRKTMSGKWGEQIASQGFTEVPNGIIQRMALLNITPVEMVFLLLHLSVWWHADRLPRLTTTTMSGRSGLSVDELNEARQSLCRKGLIEMRRLHVDFTGLKVALHRTAPEKETQETT